MTFKKAVLADAWKLSTLFQSN